MDSLPGSVLTSLLLHPQNEEEGGRSDGLECALWEEKWANEQQILGKKPEPLHSPGGEVQGYGGPVSLSPSDKNP